jgi:hypothetical protein
MLAPRHCRWSRQEIKWQSDAVGTSGTLGRAPWKGGNRLHRRPPAFAVDKADDVIINSPETA